MSLDIHFATRRGSFALNVDLSLPDHGVTAIFGPSGSGKTTLLRVLAGLEHIPGCRLRFGDTVWQDESTFIPPHQRATGYVFQEPGLFSHLSVRRNLAFGLDRVPPHERSVSLDDAIELLDIGELLDRRPETLSGGEQQRVAIARTLAVSPRLLLMDEPLSSLDNKLKQEILPYLENLHRELGIPVIYVSHATDEVARLADHLVILRKGEILGHGPIRDMLTRLDLPLAHRRDAESLIEASVTGNDPEYGLTTLSAQGYAFVVTGAALSPGTQVRLRIAAHDVSVALAKQSGTSIQNIVPVTVAQVLEENAAQVLVKLQLGTDPLLARITRKSARDLGLVPGLQVFAQIKGIAVPG